MEELIQETQELCTLCGGRGTEMTRGISAVAQTCRLCQGSRWRLVKRVLEPERDWQPAQPDAPNGTR